MQLPLMFLAALLIVGPTPARYVELTGAIVSIDREREVLRLHTERGVRVVDLFDETEYVTPTGSRARLGDLRVGEEVRVRGEERGARVLAHQIAVLDRAAATVPGRVDMTADGASAVITGVVRTPTRLVSRKIKVRAPDGEVTVEADRDATITQFGERVSVHELERGDHVRITGVWTGENRIRAARIEVTTPVPAPAATRGYRETLRHEPMPIVSATGFLVSYDPDRNRMRLSTGSRDRLVVADGTPAYDHDERISRRKLRQGDRVRATGYWNGREILATRIERVD